MLASHPKTNDLPETISDENQGKLFDNYGPVEVRESIGTFFLGVLAVMLFLALWQLQNRYETLLKQTGSCT